MTQLLRAMFIGSHGKLREGWWIATFLLLVLVLLMPLLLLSEQAGRQPSVAEQALIILAATWVCQHLRRRSLAEVTGPPDRRWAAEFSIGAGAGSVLMLLPACVLLITGTISWQATMIPVEEAAAAIGAMLIVAIAEELLFRGFLFQRLLSAIGIWPAQLAIAGLFLLTHLHNPGMSGGTAFLAGINIFMASMLFGFAYVRTQSLAMPIGLHWMANAVQGPLLGLGVSGNSGTGVLHPSFLSDAAWLTGGVFGLEASVPGTLCVGAALVIAAAAGRGSSARGGASSA
ncbi:MAG TPA: CPBP family intramembrane glutamic endopeptidase [Sphingomicrobium sp.]|nr:CPBP family intramembrane glutamic endopeptidase [Sphingomicrobium sp.]